MKVVSKFFTVKIFFQLVFVGFLIIAYTILSIKIYGPIGLYKTQSDLKKQLEQEKEKLSNYQIQDKCLESMTKTLMISYNLSRWEAHYYSIIFNDFSKNFNIPWEIYPAITRIESNFISNIGSDKGAKGMMQILESTGESIANEYDIDYVVNQTLWNSVTNLVLGCGYLSKNIKEKGLEGGVKCYLGGPCYLKTIKVRKGTGQYIGEYKSSVWKEYRQLSCIFKGIVSESDKDLYDKIHPYKDSIFNVDLFVFKKDTTRTCNKIKTGIKFSKQITRAHSSESIVKEESDTIK